MKLAIMQPYLFPYIGYFQLVAAVDKFVVYDDVNFIKGGWINRNNVLLNKKSTLFTVPLDKASPFDKINETNINLKLFSIWKVKFLRSLEQSYKKAPYFTDVYPLLETILNSDNVNLISELAVKSIITFSEYLELGTEIVSTSSGYNNQHLSGPTRVIDICKKENASHYINAIGGMELYSKDAFQQHDITLNFIKPKPINYTQFGNEFVPWLSIIDLVMFNSVADTKVLISKYDLL
jgi:hypothetical protein